MIGPGEYKPNVLIWFACSTHFWYIFLILFRLLISRKDLKAWGRLKEKGQGSPEDPWQGEEEEKKREKETTSLFDILGSYLGFSWIPTNGISILEVYEHQERESSSLIFPSSATPVGLIAKYLDDDGWKGNMPLGGREREGGMSKSR